MENKPFILFASFMVVAAIVIAGYLSISSPFNASHSARAADQGMGDQQAMILYLHNCASCHGPAGNGLNGNPSLANNGLPDGQIAEIIKNGKGKMPGLSKLTDEQIQKIARFVKKF